jgi:hypothetical protein
LRGGQQGDGWSYQRGEAREKEKVGRTREDWEKEDVGSRWKFHREAVEGSGGLEKAADPHQR